MMQNNNFVQRKTEHGAGPHPPFDPISGNNSINDFSIDLNNNYNQKMKMNNFSLNNNVYKDMEKEVTESK